MSSSRARINEKLAVELLQQLLQFIDTNRHRNFKPNNSASLENVGAVVVSRRFDLRYVCLLWHNIVPGLTCLNLNCGEHYFLFNAAIPDDSHWYTPWNSVFSAFRENTEPLKSCVAVTKKNRNGEWFTLAHSIGLLHVSVYNHQSNNKSVLLALSNATKGIDHPCDLSLNLNEWDVDAAGTILRDPDADFAKLHPNLTLRELRLETSVQAASCEVTDSRVARMRECANYFFAIGQQTLRYAKVQLFVLEGLPEDWVCESLRNLRLDLDPQGFGQKAQWSKEKMLQEFDKQAIIRRLFPNVEKITLRADYWPQIDLIWLNQLAHLKTLVLEIYPHRRNGSQQNDWKRTEWRLAALSRIKSLDLSYYFFKFPMPLCEFVPNLTRLNVSVMSENGCTALLCELGTSKDGLAQLIDLRVDCSSAWGVNLVPEPSDVVALFAGLHRLPALSSLEFVVKKDFNLRWCCAVDWTSPCYCASDLALLHSLPPGLSSVSLFYCLVPAPVLLENTPEVNFICDPNIPSVGEWIYQTWFHTVIYRLSAFPKLERFHCKIVAPSFHAAVSLAAKWSKSSSAAIADLGLASIIYVSCSTEAYSSIEAGQIYAYGDTLKFRFTLAPRSDLASKKFSTRMFTFELEHWCGKRTYPGDV